MESPHLPETSTVPMIQDTLQVIKSSYSSDGRAQWATKRNVRDRVQLEDFPVENQQDNHRIEYTALSNLQFG